MCQVNLSWNINTRGPHVASPELKTGILIWKKEIICIRITLENTSTNVSV